MASNLVALVRRFSHWCHEFGTLILLPLIVIIITLDVVLRYFFNAPFTWGEEINGLLLFLILMLSMTHTWDKNRHIRMELVYVLLGRRWRAVADIAAGLSGIIFFGLLGVQSMRDIVYMIRTNEGTDVLHITLWPFRALLALISAVFVLKLVHYVFAGRKEIEDIELEREGVVIPRKVR